ncbi:hypothetical protein WMY93_014562 [Mugilogobius chulae]|uniref:Uncharacterized protein n=1 Tax=Mugilogobius chulae TaxID=88201 RepID=A0AAW0NZJ9_9GOBI
MLTSKPVRRHLEVRQESVSFQAHAGKKIEESSVAHSVRLEVLASIGTADLLASPENNNEDREGSAPKYDARLVKFM